MRKIIWMGTAIVLTCLAWAQAPAGAPAHLLVSVEAKKGTDVPEVKREDVLVFEGRDRDTVTEWIPARGDRAALELFILLDDSSSVRLGSQMDSIKQFINAQPATAKIGIAYMQDGAAHIEQNLTDDHAQAQKAIRLPAGVAGLNASPYFSLSDLVKKWPASMARREVLMVTDGIDRYYGVGDPNDPYMETAIDQAVKAGITVSAIYNPGAGHFGHSYWQTYWGQIYLSQVTDKTGGEGYYIGFTGEAVSFQPYLEDFARRLNNQYFLTFLAKPPKKPSWQPVKLRCEIGSVDLVSAGRVWVQ
jgi:hypothetical protein